MLTPPSSGFGPLARRPLLLCWAILAAIPVAYIVATVVATSRNVAFWDEFTSLDFVLRLDAHTGGWRDLLERFFSVDSEHRTFTTRLIFALSYWLTGSVNFHVIGAIGNLSLLALCGVMLAATDTWERRGRLAVLLAFGLFQLEHFESFVWSGASIDHFLVLFLAGTALVLVQRGSPGALAAAVVFALLANFTLAHGCVAWPVGAALLARGRRWRHLAVWVAAAALGLGAFFHGFQIHPSHRLAGFNLAEFKRLGEYWLALVGSPLVLGSRRFAPCAGLLLLAALAWALRRGAWSRQPLAVALAAFALGSLGLVAVGRVEIAGAAMINSRYFVLGALAWTMTLFMLVEHLTDPARPFRVLTWCLPLLVAFNVSADVQFAPLAQTFVEARDRAASRFRQFEADGRGIFRLNPIEGRAEQVLGAAKQRGIYQLPRYSEPAAFPAAQPSARIVSYVDELIANRRAVTVGGWAMIPGRVSKRGSVYVVLRSPHSLLMFSALPLQRQDVADAYKEPRWRWSGFRAVVDCDGLPAEDFDVGVLIAGGDHAEFTMTPNRLLLSAPDPAAQRLANAQ